MLILASASPRRSDLLSSIGVKFTVVPADVDEELLANESPEDAVLRLAKLKAEVVAREHRDKIVLAADTTVVFEGRFLAKPLSVDEAEQMLAALSGNTHFVYTAYALVQASKGVCKTELVKTEVTFSKLSREEIRAYVASGEPMDKAGAYAAQGIGAGFVSSINGSYTNVVGLPLAELVQDFKELGIKGYFF